MIAVLSLRAPMSSFNEVTVDHVVDGDTVSVTLPYLPDIFQHIGVRVKGIDSPEMHAVRACERRDAISAKEMVKELVSNENIDLNFCEPDKYFRALCTIRVDQTDLGSYMIEAGLAVPYSGGKKQKWKCRKGDTE